MPAPELEAVEAALAAGDLAGAVGRLQEVVATHPHPEAHELLAGLLLADDDLVGARTHAEAAFRLWRQAGEPRRAARVAADLAELHGSGFGNRAVGQGWLARADRLLAPLGRCVEQGYVALAMVACAVPDLDELRRSAELALDLAVEFGDTALEVRALADSGYAMVVQGRQAEGFRRLDEAMAILSTGEVADPAVAGMSFCALLSACDRAGDVPRTEEWTRVLTDTVLDPQGGRPRVLHTHCRLAYGSVLCSAGRWQEGETSLLEVLGPGGSMYQGHRADAAARLASLRLLQGRTEEAAELLRPFEDRPSSLEPLARLHLQRGDPDVAAAVAHRGLDVTGSDLLRAVALRALLVEIELARDDPAAARIHADALADLAERCDSPAVRVETHLARARVATSVLDVETARAELTTASTLLDQGDRPLLAATVCLELGQTLADAGDLAAAVPPVRSALDTFERLGAKVLLDRSDALLRSLGPHSRSATRRPGTALVGLTGREREVLALVCDGLTNAEIGGRLYISTKTAEHHVGRVLSKLGVRSRAEAAAVATAGGLLGTPDAGVGATPSTE